MYAPALLSLTFAALALGKGFTVPEGTADGVYAVTFDDDGSAVHTPLNSTMPARKMPRRGLGASSLKQRRGGPQVGDVSCSGDQLDPHDTDAANGMLNAQCDSHVQGTPALSHVYSISGGVVAYFCVMGDTYSCDSGTRDANDQAITLKCGRYVSGSTFYGVGYTGGWGYGYDKTSTWYCDY